MKGRTTAVIVNWNGARFLDPLLQSLRKEEPAKIVVIDNDSHDASSEILARHSDVHVIRNTENAGFAAAANQGIRIIDAIAVVLKDERIRSGTEMK